MSTREQLDLLLDLIHHVRPTLDDDCAVTYEPTADEEGFRVFVDNPEWGQDRPTHMLDLYYQHKDSLGHLVKVVRPIMDGVTQDLYFYAHGHILGALLSVD